MLNYDTPHDDEFDFDGKTTSFTFHPFRWLGESRVSMLYPLKVGISVANGPLFHLPKPPKVSFP